MKKFGFTLAELLISLTIIGVAAAVSVPAIKSFLPDRDKMKVIKYYSIVQSATNELINDEKIYWQEYDPNNDGTIMYPMGLLSNEKQPLAGFYSNSKYSGPDKFKNLLFHKLGADDNGLLPDGSNIVFSNQTPIKLTIDINGDDGANCSFPQYNDNPLLNCNKPDQFSFSIELDGRVSAHQDDMLTTVYLRNSKDFHRKKQDYLDAKALQKTSPKIDIPENPEGTTPIPVQ